jgi:protein-L-isoaspartate(D-aspartate) O-methyltransferase
MGFKEENEFLIKSLIEQGVLRTQKLINAFRKIMRHDFVPKKYLHSAYEDIPLPLTEDSRATISQPLTVAYMLEALNPKKGEKILDVGTGSGWQACLLAYCVSERGKVVTIEIDKEVYQFAKKNIKKYNFKNIILVRGDGSLGYEKEAPYDKIIVAAAAYELPKPLRKQIKIGGRIVAPIGGRYEQQVIVFDKISESRFKKKSLGHFVFVPLLGKYGMK